MDNNSIIIKKYSQVENIKDISINICNIIGDVCNVDIMISDREKIIACNSNLKNLLNTELALNHKRLIDNRESYISTKIENMYNINNFFTIVPIITTNDCSGLIFIITNENTDVNLKYARIVQKLIVQKIDVDS